MTRLRSHAESTLKYIKSYNYTIINWAKHGLFFTRYASQTQRLEPHTEAFISKYTAIKLPKCISLVYDLLRKYKFR